MLEPRWAIPAHFRDSECSVVLEVRGFYGGIREGWSVWNIAGAPFGQTGKACGLYIGCADRGCEAEGGSAFSSVRRQVCALFALLVEAVA